MRGMYYTYMLYKSLNPYKTHSLWVIMSTLKLCGLTLIHIPVGSHTTNPAKNAFCFRYPRLSLGAFNVGSTPFPIYLVGECRFELYQAHLKRVFDVILSIRDIQK